MDVVKFYVGEVNSYRTDFGRGEEEVLIVGDLDCILSANTQEAVDRLDETLRRADKSFVRSDCNYRILKEV